jgi:hypothetical protein
MLDSETWKNKPYNFKRAEALIWNTIAPRAAHQQRVENLVQTAGHLGKTHVEEVRRSARAKIHSIFYRDFKIWALDIIRKEDVAEWKEQQEIEEKRRVKRWKRAVAQAEREGKTPPTKPQATKMKPLRRRMKVEGKRRLELHARWIDRQSKEIDEAIEFLESRQKGLMATISDRTYLRYVFRFFGSHFCHIYLS